MLEGKRISESTVQYAKQVNVLDLAYVLGIPLEKRGKHYFTNCIVHSENTPSLAITPEKNLFKCYGACGISGSAINFYMYYHWKELNSSRFPETVIGICETMGHPVLYEDGTQITFDKQLSFIPQSPIEKPKAEYKAPIELIRSVYRSLIHHLPLYSHHEQHLVNERFFSEGEITVRQYRSFPKKEIRDSIIENLLIEYGSLEGVPGFFRIGANWQMVGSPGIMIPIRDAYGNISSFQVRLDYPGYNFIFHSRIGEDLRAEMNDGVLQIFYRDRLFLTEKIKSPKKIPIIMKGAEIGYVHIKHRHKYRWFSSAGWTHGTSIDSQYHISYPLNAFPDGLSHSSETVWVTEGPFKGDRCCEVTRCAAISIPGISQWRLGVQGVHCLQPKHVIIALDADALLEKPKLTEVERDENDEPIGKAIEGLIEEFSEMDIHVSIAAWDVQVAKGIDDLFNIRKKPQIFRIL